MRIGIKERTLWDGATLVPLESKSIDWLRSKLQQLKPEAVAVVLLYSFQAPQAELRIAEALGDFGIPVSLSHQILPEFREYERTSTTLINAYVQPIMSRYLGALGENELVRKGSLTVMQSNGGSISATCAAREPVRTLFSGPAGGVVGAFEVAKAAGYDRIISFDMGGTSTDVCVCDGRIETTGEAVIDHHPVSIQAIGVHSVGAGGGSIAWVDEGGFLKVGPRSAGADPGPICYGKGDQLTVTDANVFLGRIDPDHFLGGEMKLQPEGIEAALDRIAAELALSQGLVLDRNEISDGIVRIVNTQMERALRLISLQRGHDTRDFTLVAFGGAGGLHACDLASALMIPRVLVPLQAGALSALGILRSDVVRDASITFVTSSQNPDMLAQIETAFSDLQERVLGSLVEQGFDRAEVEIERSLDVRYLGQSFELNVPFSSAFIDAFHDRHRAAYGYSNPGLPVEAVNLRVRGRAKYPLPSLPKFKKGPAEPAAEALVQEKKDPSGKQKKDIRYYHNLVLTPKKGR